MKNVTLLMAMFLVMLSACSGESKNYIVRGELPDSSFHGKTIYAYSIADERCVDSAVVDGKILSFRGTAPDTAYTCWVGISHAFYADFVLEEGEINVDFVQHTASGTYLNDEMARVEAIVDSLVEVKEKASSEFEGRGYEYIEYYYNVWCPSASPIVEDIFLRHTNDVVGAEIISGMFVVLGKERQLELLESCGPWLGNTPDVLRKKKILKAQIPTDEGKMFADVKGTNLEGNPLLLSDFVGKGDYVLADFWGSWCTPCRMENPNLKELHDKYNGKGLVVLGVCIWDSISRTKTAVEEDKIVWPQLVDSGDSIWRVYGIHRVPSTIFFAPDGTILKRDIRGEMMKSFVSKHLDGEV